MSSLLTKIGIICTQLLQEETSRTATWKFNSIWLRWRNGSLWCVSWQLSMSDSSAMLSSFSKKCRIKAGITWCTRSTTVNFRNIWKTRWNNLRKGLLDATSDEESMHCWLLFTNPGPKEINLHLTKLLLIFIYGCSKELIWWRVAWSQASGPELTLESLPKNFTQTTLRIQIVD